MIPPTDISLAGTYTYDRHDAKERASSGAITFNHETPNPSLSAIHDLPKHRPMKKPQHILNELAKADLEWRGEEQTQKDLMEKEEQENYEACAAIRDALKNTNQ